MDKYYGEGMSICGIVRTWNCEKTLKTHEGGATAISIGKLALTFGKDRTVRTYCLLLHTMQ
jgi:hypothetical protein